MEAHLSATVEDGLLDSLSYRPGGNSANYVLETRKVRFFAEASDTFGPNSRVIRFRLVDQGFWEPASSRIQFSIHNKDATNPLSPIAGPCAMFSRIRVFISGVQIENWDYVGESTVLMDRLKGASRRPVNVGYRRRVPVHRGLWCSKSHARITYRNDQIRKMDAFIARQWRNYNRNGAR